MVEWSIKLCLQSLGRFTAPPAQCLQAAGHLGPPKRAREAGGQRGARSRLGASRASATLGMGLDIADIVDMAIRYGHLQALARGSTPLNAVTGDPDVEIVDLPEAAALKIVHCPGSSGSLEIRELRDLGIAAPLVMIADVDIPLVDPGLITTRIGVVTIVVVVRRRIQAIIIASFVLSFCLRVGHVLAIFVMVGLVAQQGAYQDRAPAAAPATAAAVPLFWWQSPGVPSLIAEYRPS